MKNEDVRVESDRDGMALAVRAAQKGMAEGQSPFGCCIVKQGTAVAVAHNEVWGRSDATAHAEVLAITEACRNLETIDLSGCALYATCEPCPMCYSAAHWARVSKIVFGADIADALAAGFNEMQVPARKLKELAGDEVELVSGVMAEECQKLFADWKGRAY